MEITLLGDAQSSGQQLYRRLLAKRKRAPKTWSLGSETSPFQRSITSAPSFAETEGESEISVQEELAWYDRTVIWSRGAQVLQTYSFDEQSEDVVKAAFVWFPDTAAASSSGRSGRKEGAAAAYKGKSAATTGNSPFGPFTNSHQQQWGGPRGACTTSSSVFDSGAVLERTLVIFFRTFANIYKPSGETITTHLPFLIDGAWPLAEGGVVLQRSLERRERKRWAKRRAGGGVLDGMDPDRTTGSVLDELEDLDDETESLPRLYTLSTPRGEARPIAQTPRYEGGYLGRQVKVNSPTRPLSSELSIVLVSSDPYPLLIAIDHDARELVFHRWARIPTETSLQQQKARSPTQSPLQGLQTHAELPQTGIPKAASRPSAFRKRSSMGPSLGTDRRSSALGIGVADPLDRSTRRGSMQRQPRQSGIPETRSAGEMLHATLEPEDPFKAAAARPVKGKRGARGLSSAGILDDSRRVSGRLDLNRSMDRMALNVAEEADLRETTMMFGLERDDDGLASEVVTERIWSWPLPDCRDLDAEDLKAFLSDTRSHHHALLHIQFASPSSGPPTLYTFSLSLDAKATSYTIALGHGFQCQSSIPIISTRHKIPDVLLLRPSGELELQTSNDQKLPVTLSSGKPVIALSDPVGTTFTVEFADGSAARCSLDRRPHDELIRACEEVLSLVLSRKDFFALKREVILRQATSWPRFLNVLQAALGLALSAAAPENGMSQLRQRAGQAQDNLLNRLRARRPLKEEKVFGASERSYNILSSSSKTAALLGLHLLAENFRLSAIKEKYPARLVLLIAPLASNLQQFDWVDHWMRLYPQTIVEISSSLASASRSTRSSIYEMDSPPDILDHLRRILTGKPATYHTSETLSLLFRTSYLGSELGEIDPLSLTAKVVGVYRALAPSASTPISAAARASHAILTMVSGHLDEKWADQLIAAVAIPIREALKIGQAAPPRDWPLTAYRLVGRSDQALQNLAVTGTEFQRKVERLERAEFCISNLSRRARENAKGDEMSDMSHISAESLPDIRFGADKRLQEVTGMLQTSKPRCIAFTEPPNADDAELLSVRTSFSTAIAQRTMAVTVGRAMFTYATRTAVITDAWVVPDLDLSLKLYPSNSVINPALPHEMIEWPNFHNGVAAALSIAPSSNGVDSSWIVFNKPAALSASHGGFLLGLGLSGHLRCMQTWHAYPYLEPRHDPTTIGLLLGLATSFAGSQDAMITKVISLHTQALLPLGSVELNASPCIQSAALMALGFVFVGSRSHRMADAVLKEISRKAMPGVESFGEYQELYAFSASMAFGLIMLGQGGENSSHVERRMLSQLRRCISGENSAASEVHSRAEMADPTYTAPGATLALGLMFLKSGRKDVIDMISIPQTPYALDHIRPDLLMIRILARALIMWENVVPNMAWIEAQLPACIQGLHQDHKKISYMGLANELAYFNVVAGACFSIGLKYAGTATEFAHTTLMFFFGVFGKACANNSMSYEGKIRRSAARQGLNLITIALAMVMSGTGELNILRRLRIFHGQEGTGVSYGTHMAMHMACGILFLGHGRHTLGFSNMSIAAMCIACFPRFSSSPADNTSYLQAYRHLWALAVEPRCLIARDVDTRDTVYLPVKVRVMEGQKVKSQHLIAPTLVAPFERLVSIEVDSPRYWPVTYDILNNERDRQNLIRTGTIFVKRKAAFLDYNNDPKGNRSIFVRAGTMSRSDLFYDFVSAASPCVVSDEDFLALTNLHSGQPHVQTLGDILCRGQDSSFVRFAKFALLECISLDKGAVFFDYLSFYCTLRAASSRREATVHRNGHPSTGLTVASATHAAASSPSALQHLRLLQAYYSPVVFDRQYAQTTSAADKQATLFRPAFLSALVQELSDNTVDRSIRQAWFAELDAAKLDVKSMEFAMALYLGTNNVPPIALLHGLREAVPRMHRLLESAGVSREDAMAVLLGKMLETAYKYDEAIGGEGQAAAPGRAKIAIENCPRQWTVESAREALESWV